RESPVGRPRRPRPRTPVEAARPGIALRRSCGASPMSVTEISDAPPLEVERWFNTDDPPTLERLRGKVVVLHAFQMLCPGCVAHALPQAKRLHEIAQHLDDLVVLGLHSVFEHHAAMTPIALEAFLHEYKIAFPVAVDRAAADGPIPRTMAAYGLR